MEPPESFLPPDHDVIRARLDFGSLRVELFRVAEPDALMDSVDPEKFQRDGLIPYWAELWPSAIALASFLARKELGGLEALELGCGLGLAGVVAALRGARVTFTDHEPDALAFARANHALNLGAPGRTMVLDWRAPPRGLAAPLVLASDVLYERRSIEPFLDALRSALAPGGTAYVAEPGRKIAENTVERLEGEGFRLELHLEEVEAGGKKVAVWIHEVVRETGTHRINNS